MRWKHTGVANVTDKAEPYRHIGHFCLGVEHFDADKVLATLKERGVPARMRTRGESKEP